MNSLLEIYTLGGLSIQRDHRPVTGFVSRKVEALLVYLACEPGEHPREFIAELFWDDARALANLRMALSSLQQQLETYVVVTRQIVAINPQSSIWLDVRQLENTLTHTEKVWGSNTRLPRAAMRELDAAVQLYRGDFLAGFNLRDSQGFDDWKRVEQERLRGRVIAALDRQIRQFLERGAYAEGIEHANRLLQLDPLIEETHRQMMRLQAGAGNRSAAAAQYKTCDRVLREALGIEPAAETTLLYEQIVQGTIEIIPTAPPKHNLPFPSTLFVERHEEQGYIAERLDRSDCRLLTLVGPGGTGKTRLALHAALERVEDYPDGVFLVTYTSIDSAEYLIQPIASALKLRTSQNVEAELIDYLRDKHMMLVLDNFEYVLDGVSLLDELLSHTQWLKLIVTSRERLNLQQEWVLPIGGLECPPAETVDDLEAYSAVKLFAYSAQRVQAHFSLEADTESVKRVCALVEGLPLGLELASAWTNVMSVAQIATQIEQSLSFLETTLRNIPQRHRSIRALFEHSWSMLSDAERSGLMRLSVFQREFDLEAAQAVAQLTTTILLALVEKFLVRSNAPERYDVHQLLRRYSYERLEQSGEVGLALEAHALYFTERSEQDAKNFRDERTYDYYDDVRAALGWTAEHKRADILLRLTGCLSRFWQSAGFLSEGRVWLARALELDNETIAAGVRAKAYHTAGVLARRQGDFDAARTQLQQALLLFRQIDDRGSIANTLISLGYISLNLGDHDEAKNYFSETLETGKTSNNPRIIATSLGNLGLVALELADYPAAKRYLEEAMKVAEVAQQSDFTAAAKINLGTAELKLGNYDAAAQHYGEVAEQARALKDRTYLASALINLGETAHHQRKMEQAATYYLEGLTLLREIGDQLSLIQTVELIAYLLMDKGKLDIALKLLGMTEARRQELQSTIIPRERGRYDEFVAQARQNLKEDTFNDTWAAGRKLMLDQAVELAIRNIQPK